MDERAPFRAAAAPRLVGGGGPAAPQPSARTYIVWSRAVNGVQERQERQTLLIKLTALDAIEYRRAKLTGGGGERCDWDLNVDRVNLLSQSQIVLLQEHRET